MGLIFAALSAPVQALEGAGMLLAKEKLKARGCGKEKVESVLVFELAPDFKWTATTEALREYRGTWRFCCVRRASEKGRIELDFLKSSLEDFKSDMGDRVSALCGEPVLVTSAIRKKFKGKVKNGEAKIKIKFDLTSTGSSAGGVWKVKANGPFTDIDP